MGKHIKTEMHDNTDELIRPKVVRPLGRHRNDLERVFDNRPGRGKHRAHA